MIVATAYVPETPLLLPAMGAGAAAELDDLRAATFEVVRAVIASAPDRIVVLGGGALTREHPGDAAGSFHGFGLDLTVGGRGRVSLPPPLTLGAWLLDDAGWDGERVYSEVAADAEPEGRAASSRRILERPGRTAMLVVADGSATRTEEGPRGFDARAVDFDEDIATAMRDGDLLLGPVDTASGAALAEELAVGGLAAWRVAAQVHWYGGRPVSDARLLRHEAPLGVGYLVASWSWAA